MNLDFCYGCRLESELEPKPELEQAVDSAGLQMRFYFCYELIHTFEDVVHAPLNPTDDVDAMVPTNLDRTEHA